MRKVREVLRLHYAAGKGGGRRAGGRALDTGCASSSHVLLAGRAQRGHRRAPSAAQRARVAQAPGVAALAVRPTRPSRASPAAHRALRVRRVEEGPGQHRLPRRGRRALLLRPPRPGPAPARRAPHRPHRGVPVPRPARGQPRALFAQRPPHHRRRAHAREAPPDGAVDARALHPLGREDRPAHRHPQQAFRSCLGILRLAKSYGEARLEAAAWRALAIGSHSYRSVESIPRFRRSGAGLAHRLDGTASEPVEPAAPLVHHNIRGAGYYS